MHNAFMVHQMRNINNITNLANCANIDPSMIEFYSFHGDDSKHNGIDLVEISKTFATHEIFFVQAEPFN